MADEPTWRERREEARPYIGPALALAIVVGMAGWLAWWFFSGRERGTRTASPAGLVDSGARARILLAESLAREQEAARAREEGRVPLAGEKLREALRLQRELNTLLTGAEKDAARESRLVAALEQLDAEPLRVAVAAARSLAAAARVRESWPEALKALEQARAAQAELNARFPDGPVADRAMLDTIAAETADVLAAQAVARELGADAAAMQGRRTEAAAAYAQAEQAWREIAGRIRHLQPNAASRIEALGAKRETVLAADALEKVAAIEREIEGALRARRFAPAVEKIGEAAALLEQVSRTFPRGLGGAGETRRKIAFLAEQRPTLEAIAAEVERSLTPLPGGQSLDLLRMEVTQDLYARVAGGNPSRQAGRLLPVDSVTWAEAREFCTRLSWLLGRAVRLPSEAEFRAARLMAPEKGWSAENSQGRAREVGSASGAKPGAVDLAGNVAEWLQPTQADGATAPVAGGSYLDSTETLERTPIVAIEKRLRARHIGFRVVVERAQ